MQNCQFAKSVIERGSGKFSAARPDAVSSVELKYSRSRPCFFCFRKHREIMTMVFSSARLWLWLSWSSQILLRHVPDLRTPLLRQGGVTDSVLPSVPYIHSALAVDGSARMYYLLQLGSVVVYIIPFRWVGILVFRPCLFVVGVSIYYYFRGKACFMVHSLSRYFFTCVTGRPGGGGGANIIAKNP